jgi:hypothetical protein
MKAIGSFLLFVFLCFSVLAEFKMVTGKAMEECLMLNRTADSIRKCFIDNSTIVAAEEKNNAAAAQNPTATQPLAPSAVANTTDSAAANMTKEQKCAQAGGVWGSNTCTGSAGMAWISEWNARNGTFDCVLYDYVKEK